MAPKMPTNTTAATAGPSKLTTKRTVATSERAALQVFRSTGWGQAQGSTSKGKGRQ
ncbi:hypothetical protein TRAPUB_11883 [Trametes pubescens]|uniref:Uncharacterized protein n=1 Tax=Trametes pubescens TaxID=154538 RepID=A0A1M2VVG0_TRAPU|nr:hypothetical protein TRAPUB_11883 [Trametes pubescens]